MVRMVIADDHEVIRQGLRAILQSDSEFTVVAEAADGLEAIGAVEKTRPDVLILDISMPGMNGLEVVSHVRRISPNTKVLVLSVHDAEPYVFAALKNGARGYVLKGDESTLVARAAREVASGRLFLSPSLSVKVVETYIRNHKDTTEAAPGAERDKLTPREKEVLRLVSQGKTSAQAGAMLSIGSRTVEKHRASVMCKLDLKSTRDLVQYAIRNGII